MKRIARVMLVLAPIIVIALAVPGWGAREARASSGADKIGVEASDVQVLQTQLVAGSSSQEVTLLSGTIKTSTPADLKLGFTAECALWTDVQVAGTGQSTASAAVKVWSEVDGAPVPVTADGQDDGQVVLCNREFSLSLANLLPSQIVDLFEKTKAANAFTWMALNLGAGDHTVAVKARLDAYVSGTGKAEAGVGKRTLIGEPVHLAPDASY